MIRVGEHIHRLDGFRAVAVMDEKGEVPRLCFGVAGNINDPAGREHGKGSEKAFVAAGAGRIQEDHVCRFPVFRHGGHEFARIRADEADIFHPVQLCVDARVPHGVCIQLRADHRFCPAACENPDGADAAVSVDHRFLAGEPCQFNRLAVEDFRLNGVDLVKRTGGNTEAAAAEGIGNGSGTVKHGFPFPEHQAGFIGVYVHHYGGDIGMPLQERLHKVPFGGENGGGSNQHHHDFTACKAALYEHVAQKAAPGALIIGGELEILQQAADGDNDRIRFLIFDQAAVHRDDTVAAGLIHTRNDPAAARRAEGGLHLVAVMIWVLHPDDRGGTAETCEQAVHLALLPGELLGIAPILELAAAAFLMERALPGHSRFPVCGRGVRAGCFFAGLLFFVQ